MDIAFLDKHGRVKFRPSVKQKVSPETSIVPVDTPLCRNTYIKQENVNTRFSKHHKLASNALPEPPTLRRRRLAIPHPQSQPTEARTTAVQASLPTSFPNTPPPWSRDPPSTFASSPQSLIPLPLSPTKPRKATSLVFRSSRSPRAKVDQLFGFSNSPEAVNQSLSPSPSNLKGRGPVLLTQIRADERTRKELEAQMAKKGKKKSAPKADTPAEPLPGTPVEEQTQLRFVCDSTTPKPPPALAESTAALPKLNAQAKAFTPSPNKSFGCPNGGLCSHQAPQRKHGPAGRHPDAYRKLELGVSPPIRCAGDPKEYQVHVTPTGSFCTTTDGILCKMPEECMLQGLDQFSLNLPSGTNLNSLLIGRPYMSQFGNSELPQPYNSLDMPSPGSAIAEQFLIAATKLNSIYNRREGARSNPTYEPPIQFGFAQRAHFAQGARANDPFTKSHSTNSHSDLSGSKFHAASGLKEAKDTRQKNLHMKNEAPLRNAEILPALRGGGPSHLRGDLCTKSGLSNIKGRYPELVASMSNMPTVVDYQGRLEVCFPPGHSPSRRICNRTGNYVALYGGSDLTMSHLEETWTGEKVYWCTYCGSEEHGIIHCPIQNIHHRANFCLHCREHGHILANCPRPPQFFPGRPVSQTIELYVFGQHWKEQLFAWELKLGVRLPSESAIAGLDGAGRHPFGLLGPCPDCGPVHHTAKAIEWINTIVAEVKLDETFNRKCNWYVDTRYCPLYWILSHPALNAKGYTIYNPLGSVAVDALYRVYISCQGWVTKKPCPIAKEHIFRRVKVKGKWVVIVPDFAVAQS